MESVGGSGARGMRWGEEDEGVGYRWRRRARSVGGLVVAFNPLLHALLITRMAPVKTAHMHEIKFTIKSTKNQAQKSRKLLYRQRGNSHRVHSWSFGWIAREITTGEIPPNSQLVSSNLCKASEHYREIRTSNAHISLVDWCARGLNLVMDGSSRRVEPCVKDGFV